jgi:hypothetical protein
MSTETIVQIVQIILCVVAGTSLGKLIYNLYFREKGGE